MAGSASRTWRVLTAENAIAPLERLDENLGSADLDLSPEDLAELDSASSSVQVQGDRYPESMQRMIDR